MEHGEEPQQSLVRELHEELGWAKVTIKKIIDVWVLPQKLKTNITILLFWFVVVLRRKKI